MARLARRSAESALSRSLTRGRWTASDGPSRPATRPRGTSVALVAALTLLLALGIGKLAADTLTASAQEGAGGAATADPCSTSGLTPVGDTGLCTHGPDEPPPGTGVGASDVSGAGADPAITCEGNGSTGNRVQVLFGSADATATSAQLAEIRSSAANANQIYRDGAAQTGGARSIRFVHSNVTRGCQIDIRLVRLSSSAISGSFSATINDLKAAGYTSVSRKYLVYVEANALCGIGTVFPDDRRDATNRNNRETSYSRVDDGLGRGFNCWTADVAAHELMHNLGAVQDTAPNTSSAGHCTDEWDVMCYDDDFNPGTAPMRTVCPNANDLTQLDCNHDDYFHTSPPTGSYLQTRWNSAQSRFLIGAVDQPAYPRPRNDPFASPTATGSGRFTETLIVNSATSNYDEDPAPSCNGGYNPDQTVWYEVKSAQGGAVTVNTVGSKFQTVVSVHHGTQGNLDEDACQSDSSGNGASDVRFSAVANRTYYVMVGAYYLGNANELTVTIVSPGGGTLSLDKDKSKFNGIVNATVSGLAPNSAVTLRWPRAFPVDPDEPPVTDVLTRGQTDGSGRATLSFKTPLEPLGDYVVTARDAAGGQGSDTLRVIPRIMLNEDQGPNTTRLRVYFYGFAPNERIEVRWHSGGTIGSGYQVIKTLTVAGNGRASSIVVIPSNTGTGSRMVVGKVIDVSRSASTPFNVTVGGVSVDEPTPTRTATSKATATALASPTETATPVPTAAEPPTATTVPLPTETPIPTEEPTVEPTPTETPAPNASPVAVAGDDQTVTDADATGDEPVTLDGGGSSDPEGEPLTFSWSVDSVDVAVGVDATVTLPVGSTTLLLTVTDEQGAMAADEVVIVVEPASPDGEGV